MANDPLVRVTFKGPFFKSDAGRVIGKETNKAINEVAKIGVKEVKSQLTKGHGKFSGEYRRSIKRKKKGFSARVFSPLSMISAWLEGTSKRNRNTRFKGYLVWSNAYERTEQQAKAIRRELGRTIVRELDR